MNDSIRRRQALSRLGALGLGSLGGLGSSAVLAQDAFPSKGPVKVIVPLPAGGAADAGARIVTNAMQAQMKQNFVVDNKPGASFLLAMQAMAQAPADGYTIMHINNGMCAVQSALKKFDMVKALAPISLMGTMTTVLCVPTSSSYKSVADLLAAKPGSLSYGSVGIGSLEHLWGSRFSKRHKLDAVHVPFKGAPDAATAMGGGDIQYMAVALAVALPLVQRGAIRPLAVTDTERSPALPSVPTLKELGVDAPTLVFWGGFAAPRGTPAPVLEVLRRGIAGAVVYPDAITRLTGIGTTPMASATTQSFEALIDRELAWMGDAVKEANLQLN